GARLRVSVDRADPAAVDAVRELDGVTAAEIRGDEILVRCADGTKSAVVSTLEDEGVAVSDFSTEEASLEDLFREYTEAST
ncbi:DUF4162 domain-containing protein, partial [Natronoarchaeum mannanilyticum]